MTGVRAGQAADLDALLAIEERSFSSDRLERHQFRHALRSPTVILLVAETAGGIVGYGLVETRRNARAARLTSLAVAPEAAGRGSGGALLQALERETRARGFDALRLEVRADNEAARRLYERQGFGRAEVVEGYYEDGTAAWRYAKTLAL